jgi:pimeloyl-ACP methyl ester carboxylesterase
MSPLYSTERSFIMINNVVLVHGAWADGSSWSKVVPLLEAEGLNPVCVQLPLSSLEEDVAATNRIVNAQDGPVILVGHSYGGAIITVAGGNPKVEGLVYVAAFAPDKGETLGGMSQPYGPTPIAAELRPIADGFLLVSPKGIRESFAQDLSPAEQQLVLATQGPFQSSIFGTPIPAAAWQTKPSWFVVASNDRAISPQQEKATAERMGAKILTLPTSHVAMLAKPKEVASLIIEAAQSAGKSKQGELASVGAHVA